MPDGYARIAVRAKLPLVMGYGMRTKDGILARLHPPFYPDPSLPTQQAIIDLVQRVMNEFEGLVRAYPEQWLLISPLWHPATVCSQKDEGST